ncbi:unnamed protein product [Tilletia controversa]|uniref:Uncharacterized protein n=2 Tax=Tilletia TaxID=13289 RepID=A0A8X7SSY5_9BASI|nr:hypothetical protein A4X06_0g8670 [Tilletia controversa]CAD6971186.1 unnamed protein product [Tilletia controversa]
MRQLLPCLHSKAGRAAARVVDDRQPSTSQVSTSTEPAATAMSDATAPPPPPAEGEASAALAIAAANAAIAWEEQRAHRSPAEDPRLLPAFALPAALGQNDEDSQSNHEEEPAVDPLLVGSNSQEQTSRHNDGVVAETEGNLPSVPEDAAAVSSDSLQAINNNKKTTRKRVREEQDLTDRQQRSIWLNINNAHSHAKKNFQYENRGQERARVAGRSTWRLVEAGAKLSGKTGMGVIIALAHLDNGKHTMPDYVYVSENLCDAAAPELRTMAQLVNKEFKTAVHQHRALLHQQAAANVEANKRLIAEKAALQEEVNRLRLQLGTSTATYAPVASDASSSQSAAGAD